MGKCTCCAEKAEYVARPEVFPSHFVPLIQQNLKRREPRT